MGCAAKYSTVSMTESRLSASLAGIATQNSSPSFVVNSLRIMLSKPKSATKWFLTSTSRGAERIVFTTLITRSVTTAFGKNAAAGTDENCIFVAIAKLFVTCRPVVNIVALLYFNFFRSNSTPYGWDLLSPLTQSNCDIHKPNPIDLRPQISLDEIDTHTR